MTIPEDDKDPHIAREAICDMHDVANLQENGEGGLSLDDLVSSLNGFNVEATEELCKSASESF